MNTKSDRLSICLCQTPFMAGDRSDDSRSRGRSTMGDVVHGLLQPGCFPLEICFRSLRKSTGNGCNVGASHMRATNIESSEVFGTSRIKTAY